MLWRQPKSSARGHKILPAIRAGGCHACGLQAMSMHPCAYTCMAASNKSIPVKSARIYLRCCARKSASQEVDHTLDPGVGRRSNHP